MIVIYGKVNFLASISLIFFNIITFITLMSVSCLTKFYDIVASKMASFDGGYHGNEPTNLYENVLFLVEKIKCYLEN